MKTDEQLIAEFLARNEVIVCATARKPRRDWFRAARGRATRFAMTKASKAFARDQAANRGSLAAVV